jgi:AraC family transcriptional activator of mtrCDE
MPYDLGSNEMTTHPIPRKEDLDNLVASLEVNVVALTECLVGLGSRLSFPAIDRAAIHYALKGHGRLAIVGVAPVPVRPHTLIIVPPGRPFCIEGRPVGDTRTPLKTAEARMLSFNRNDTIQRFSTGEEEPDIVIICGYFHASYGASIDLFATLRSPIVEQFDALDHLAHSLKVVLSEISSRKVGMRAMTAAALKQVFVTLLRRSLLSTETWMERFCMLSDPQIARAFANMVEIPGAPHSIQSLAQAANLSRSAFMQRFLCAFGQPPMVVLRQLRMRQAANLLTANSLSVDQVARAVGYSSRSSFTRAFRQAYGSEPDEHRPPAKPATTQPAHT